MDKRIIIGIIATVVILGGIYGYMTLGLLDVSNNGLTSGFETYTNANKDTVAWAQSFVTSSAWTSADSIGFEFRCNSAGNLVPDPKIQIFSSTYTLLYEATIDDNLLVWDMTEVDLPDSDGIFSASTEYLIGLDVSPSAVLEPQEIYYTTNEYASGQMYSYNPTTDSDFTAYSDRDLWFEIYRVPATATDPPVPCFTVSTTTPQVNDDVTFDASCTTDPDSTTLEYRWDWTDDGSYDTSWLTTASTTHAYATTGSKTIRLQVRDSDANRADTTQTITVGDGSVPLNIDISGPSSATTDTSVAFTSTVTGGTPSYTYIWDFGVTAATSNEANPSYTYTSSGTYTVSCQVSDSASPSATDSDQYTITISDEVVTYDVTITVEDSNGDPIEDAYVTLLSSTSTYFGYTESDGTLTLNVPPTSYELSVKKVGYVLYVKTSFAVTGEMSEEVELSSEGFLGISFDGLLPIILVIVIIVVSVLLAFFLPVDTRYKVVILVLGITFAIVLYILMTVEVLM